MSIKTLFKETAVYGLSSIVGRFLNWLLVPLYVRVLASTADYGIVTNLYGWSALLLVILLFGMETAFFRFSSKDAKPNVVYATTLRAVAFISALFVAFVLMGEVKLASMLHYENHSEYLRWMAVIIAIDAVCAIPFAYLRYQGRAWHFAGLKLFAIGLNILLNLFFLVVAPWLMQNHPNLLGEFFVAEDTVRYIFISNLITSGITLLALFPTMLPALRVKADFNLLMRMLNYAFPLLLLGIAGIFNQTADKILFPLLFEDQVYAHSQLGIYGACFKITIVLMMCLQAFRYAYEPFVFKEIGTGEGKIEAKKKAMIKVMDAFILFALFVFLSVCFFLDILKFFVSEAYYGGLVIIPIVMIGELFFGIYYNLSFWYKLTDETKWGAYFSMIGCVSTVAIICVFAPSHGFIACAWASFVCNLLMMLLSYCLGQKKFPIAYDLRSAAFYILVAGGLYLAGTLIEIESLPLRLGYRCVLLLVYITAAWKRYITTNKNKI